MQPNGQLIGANQNTDKASTPDRLAKVFLLDGAFSAIAAIDLMMFSDFVAGLMGSLNSEVYFGVGVASLLWSVDLFLLGFHEGLRKRFAQSVVLVDWLCVAITLFVMTAFSELWTGTGIAMLTILSAIMAGFAVAKTRSMREAQEKHREHA